MRKPMLVLAPDLHLPLAFATEGVGIVGMRGSGKSNTEVRWAETCFEAGIPFVAVDPKGDWWGIRSSADGKGPGLPVPVFGGLHGDAPLEPTMGAQIADLLVEHTLSAVLDVSRLSQGGRVQFLVAFFNRLMDRHQQDPHVRSVILEEAHRYIPQQVDAKTAVLKEAAASILLEGRSWGLGCLACTQRPARLHKDVLEEVAHLFLFGLGVAARNDKNAVRDWFRHHDMSDEIMASLSELRAGEAWVVSSSLGIAKRVRMERRRTFDSGATPTVGTATRKPSTMADIDLTAITAAMAAEIEKAKEADPIELRRRLRERDRTIADLERRIADLTTAYAVEMESLAQRPAERIEVEVPVLSDDLVSRLEEALSPAVEVLADVQDQLASARRQRDEAVDMERRLKAPTPTPAERNAKAEAAREHANRMRRDLALGVAEVPPRPPPDGDGAPLGKAERSILGALAQHGSLTKEVCAFLVGYHPKTKAYTNALGSLRSKEYIEGTAVLAITDAGREKAGPVPPLGDPVALWLSHKNLGHVERSALRLLVEAYPGTLSAEELAAQIPPSGRGGGEGYHPKTKSFTNGLGRLKGLGLVEGDRSAYKASDALMEARG